MVIGVVADPRTQEKTARMRKRFTPEKKDEETGRDLFKNPVTGELEFLDTRVGEVLKEEFNTEIIWHGNSLQSLETKGAQVIFGINKAGKAFSRIKDIMKNQVGKRLRKQKKTFEDLPPIPNSEKFSIDYSDIPLSPNMEMELRGNIFHMEQRLKDLRLNDNMAITVLNPYTRKVIHLHLGEDDLKYD